jgi:nucleoid-associated protein YgaU
MTRENKLAMVLGFGLLLFVGILVSDHMIKPGPVPPATSTFVNNATGVPPLPGPGASGIVLVGNNGNVAITPEPPAPAPEPSRSTGEPPTPESQQGGASPDRAGGRPTLPPTPSVETYTVKSGDTFARIANRVYGRSALGQRLADANGIQPSKLKVGDVIKLPPIAELDPNAAKANSTNPNSTAPSEGDLAAPKYRAYRVKPGDTLYSIAQRELGSGSRMRELQRFNVDVLKDSDVLQPGMEIRIPGARTNEA